MILTFLNIALIIGFFVISMAMYEYTTDAKGKKITRPKPRAPIGEVGHIDYVLQNEDPIRANDLRRTIFKNRNPNRTRAEKARYHKNKKGWVK